MTGQDAIRSAPLGQRVVLLAAVEAKSRDETPANSADLRAICNDRLGRADAPVLGCLSEADVTRALYRLEDAGLVAHDGPEETSPTGKGRPAYRPIPAVEAVREALADDDRLAPILADLERD